MQFQYCTHRPVFGKFCSLEIIYFPVLFFVGLVDIPTVIPCRDILIANQSVTTQTLLQNFTPHGFVIQSCETACCIQFNSEEIILEYTFLRLLPIFSARHLLIQPRCASKGLISFRQKFRFPNNTPVLCPLRRNHTTVLYQHTVIRQFRTAKKFSCGSGRIVNQHRVLRSIHLTHQAVHRFLFQHSGTIRQGRIFSRRILIHLVYGRSW